MRLAEFSIKRGAVINVIVRVGVVGVVGTLLAPMASACVTVEPWDMRSDVESNDEFFGRSTTSNRRTGFGGQPISLTMHVNRGGGDSRTQVTMDALGMRSTWSHTMTMDHEDAEPRTALIYQFSVNHDSPYALSGFYSAIAATDTRMSAIVELWDLNVGSTLFRQQIDGTTTNPALTIGQNPSMPGFQSLTGSTTGVLTAGTTYFFVVDVFMRQGIGFEENGDGAIGSGGVTLDVFDPEDPNCPSPGAAGLLGLAGTVALIRRRR